MASNCLTRPTGSEERALGWLRLAEVQFAAGDLAEAVTAARRAGELFAEKGDVLSGGRAARLRAAIEAAGGEPVMPEL